MNRRIRYFCMVGLPAPKDHAGFWWPDTAYAYLEALALTSLGIRVIPIGGAPFNVDAAHGWKRWRDRADLFTGDVSPGFLNVVCAPIGLPSGAPQFAGPEHEGSGPIRPGDLLYEPQTALTGLWTAGHRNIAITSIKARAGELAVDLPMLRKYDVVIVTEEDYVEGLIAGGVKAQFCPPSDLELLARIVGGKA